MTAEELFTETFKSIVNGWAIVTSLRQFAEISMPSALSTMEQQSGMAAEYMIQEKLVVPIDPMSNLPNENTKQLLSTLMTAQSKSNVVWAIDAASLVFMHSMLDEALESFAKCQPSIPRPTGKAKLNKKASN